MTDKQREQLAESILTNHCHEMTKNIHGYADVEKMQKQPEWKYCIAAMIEMYQAGLCKKDDLEASNNNNEAATLATLHSTDGNSIWLSEKPDFKSECVFITATKYNRNSEPLFWDYAVWQIKKLDGETESGEYGWYWGLLNGDGEEWGPLEDLSADRYLILNSAPKDEECDATGDAKRDEVDNQIKKNRAMKELKERAEAILDKHISEILAMPTQIGISKRTINPPLQQAAIAAITEALQKTVSKPAQGEGVLGCIDCGKSYDDFGLDTTLPDEQWLLINPERYGLLCSQCIVNRAAKLPNVIAIRATIDNASSQITETVTDDNQSNEEIEVWIEDENAKHTIIPNDGEWRHFAGKKVKKVTLSSLLSKRTFEP